jgi:hypothetical protein
VFTWHVFVAGVPSTARNSHMLSGLILSFVVSVFGLATLLFESLCPSMSINLVLISRLTILLVVTVIVCIPLVLLIKVFLKARFRLVLIALLLQQGAWVVSNCLNSLECLL